MKRSALWTALAIVGIGLAGAGGYWWGSSVHKQEEPPAAKSAERKILYYRNPMGLPDTSPVPKKDSMGMDYIPVYADEEAAPPTAGERKILYYRNPMGLPDTSPVPKKDSMGMDYLPVYADEATSSNQVRIGLDKIQKLGVQVEAASYREMVKTVRAVGQFRLDERRISTITTKFEGYIEKLYVNATGQPVKRGQPLMEIYSPELVSAQEEFLIAWKGQQSLGKGTEESRVGVEQLAESALRRLRNWDISESQLQRLQQEGKATRTLTLYAPASGVVLEKSALQGMRVMPGEPLFKIGSLGSIWLIAEVFEQDLSLVHPGQSVKLRIDAYPEKELTGKVTYIYPTLNPDTRTAQVRVELGNPGEILKPDMFATIEFTAGHGKSPVLMVPDSAVIDSGLRQVVLVQHAEGVFEPREVRLGLRGDGYTQVLEGVGEGEQVVVRANFLIDAESNLKAALGSFGSHSGHGASTSTSTAPAPAPDSTPTTAAPAAHEGH